MKRVLVLGGLLAAVAAVPAAAQTEFGVDAGVFSSYVWRGVTLTNKPVLQPAAYLSFPIGKASLTFGGWANVDLGTYDDPQDDISEGGGTSFNLSEFDPYVEIGYSLGKASLTWGFTGYLYPNDLDAGSNGGYNSDSNTWEAYGKASIDAPLAPSLAAYYDVDKVKGLYVEGSISHGVPLGATTLNLGATAGFNAGQGVDAGDASANFADDGFTHLDLSAGIDLSAGALTISPVVHFQLNGDDATKVRSPSKNNEDFKVWGGVTISWSKVLGGATE